MTTRWFLGALVLCGCLGCSAAAGRPGEGPTPIPTTGHEVARVPVLISYVTPDSLGLEVADSGFVMVLEHQPGSRPEVLYPPLEEEWQVHGAGLVTLRLPIGIVGEDSGSVEPAVQCIVGPVEIRSWSQSSGLGQVAAREACGPIPSLRPEDWPRARSKAIRPRPSWEFSSHLRTYLLAILIDPETPPLGIGGMIPVPDAPPVLIARRAGAAIGTRPSVGQQWHGALWLVR